MTGYYITLFNNFNSKLIIQKKKCNKKQILLSKCCHSRNKIKYNDDTCHFRFNKIT